MLRYFIPCFLALLSLLGSAQAQSRLRDGDMFEIRISGAPVEYTQEFVNLPIVVDEGVVRVPMIPGTIKATGLSTSQLAGVIEKLYRDNKIFTNPTVIINVVQNQRTIVVGGAVRSPGRMPWNQDMTLSMAIAGAAGPSEFADDKVKLTRNGKVELFSRKAIKKDNTKDPKILPGDFIEVEGEF